jgi:hypothetical protein
MILEHLDYSNVYLTAGPAVCSKDEDEVNHRFLSYSRQRTVFGRRQGWKSKIVAFEYEPGKRLPCSTTIRVPGKIS